MKSALALLLAAAGVLAAPYPIKHVVILMAENRAFDHMLASALGNETTTATNPVNVTNPSQGIMRFLPNAPYTVGDPDHSVPGTSLQIFGTSDPAPGAVGKMDGFVTSAIGEGINASEVFRYFTAPQVPVISTLATVGLAFQEWYCSVPGETIPNRLFFLSGTSHGDCDDNIPNIVLGYPQTSLMDVLNAHNISWNYYFGDIPDGLLFASMRSIDNLERFQWKDQFFIDAAAGNLSTVSFINPIFNTIDGIENATDQHPAHDVIQGELLFKSVYEALRASPVWNETLFILTYDEHGGFPDFVVPPMVGVPSPDNLTCTPEYFNFTFERQGLRVPFIAVSPWLDQGVMLSPPEALKPTPTSSWDATSVIHTLRDLFGIAEPLTARESWAPSFASLLLQRSSPRTDLPATLPNPPPGAFENPTDPHILAKSRGLQPPTVLQRSLVAVVEGVSGLTAPHLATESDVGLWTRQTLETVLGREDPVLRAMRARQH